MPHCRIFFPVNSKYSPFSLSESKSFPGASRECQLISESSKHLYKCRLAHQPFLLWKNSPLLLYFTVWSCVLWLLKCRASAQNVSWQVWYRLLYIYFLYFSSHPHHVCGCVYTPQFKYNGSRDSDCRLNSWPTCIVH